MSDKERKAQDEKGRDGHEAKVAKADLRSVFSTVKGPIAKVGEYLSYEDKSRFQETARDYRYIFANRQQLKRDIGENPDALIGVDESDEAALRRHWAKIRELQSVPIAEFTGEEIQERLEKNPHYYGRHLGLYEFIRDNSGKGLRIDALAEFAKKYSVEDRIVKDILADNKPFPLKGLLGATLFSHVTSTLSDLKEFIGYFPAYEKDVINRVLTKNEDFIRVFVDVTCLHQFCGYFSGAYARQAIERILTDDELFTHIVRDPTDLSFFTAIYCAHFGEELLGEETPRPIKHVFERPTLFFHVARDKKSLEDFVENIPGYEMQAREMFASRAQIECKDGKSEVRRESGSRKFFLPAQSSVAPPPQQPPVVEGRKEVTEDQEQNNKNGI